MKALSLTQPWASAIALGIKHWETRSWPTNLRGEICIHAAKKFPADCKEFAEEMGFALGGLPLGAIVAVCDLTQCKDTRLLVLELSETEKLYGDYADGRYAFLMENVRRLKKPLEARGALGFWDVPHELMLEVTREVWAVR